MIKKILKENIIYIILIIFFIMFFSIIMKTAIHDKVIILDNKVIEIVNSIIHTKLVGIFKVLTFLGDYYVPSIILVLLLILFKNKRIFLFQGCGYALAGIITYLSKIIISRQRPPFALIDIPKSYSFPSGHTLTSIVFYVLLCFILTYHMDSKKRKILLTISFVFSFLIAISRVYLGVHYFSDVIGGLIIGMLCLLMCMNIINKNFKDVI